MACETTNETSTAALDLLRSQYRDLTGFAAPRNLRVPLLKRLIDWHVRCIEKGVPRREAFFYRAEVISEITLPKRKSPPGVENGAVLIREYNGRVHTVRRGDNGHFYFNNRSYTSLTAVAQAITGIHQSGPRFFGIKADKARPS
ncbi:MAG: DUF2924 domain-containing protein [Oricola sp.]